MNPISTMTLKVVTDTVLEQSKCLVSCVLYYCYFSLSTGSHRPLSPFCIVTSAKLYVVPTSHHHHPLSLFDSVLCNGFSLPIPKLISWIMTPTPFHSPPTHTNTPYSLFQQAWKTGHYLLVSINFLVCSFWKYSTFFPCKYAQGFPATQSPQWKPLYISYPPENLNNLHYYVNMVSFKCSYYRYVISRQTSVAGIRH